MSESSEVNREQAANWNRESGQAWVEMQRPLDDMFAPLEKLLVEHAVTEKTQHLLDIGCGSGSTTLAAARRMGSNGACVGIDISVPLLELAKQRASDAHMDRVTFVRADVQTHDFKPTAFDAILSRFGVMFFDDPVAAFANIRRAACPGGKLVFASWRSPADNPFMTAPVRAAAPLIPSLQQPLDPNAPGQFAFADPDKVRRILESSGWKQVELKAADVATSVAENDLLEYASRLGPVGRALRGLDEPTHEKVVGVVQNAFKPFIKQGRAHFNIAAWLVTATA